MAFDVLGTGLCKRFEPEHGPPVDALLNVELKIEAGKFYVLVGDSGSGKTTLLRCIAGLDRPDSGEIVLRQRTVFSSRDGTFVPSQERQIGMVFQSYAIWPHLSVADNIALPLRHGRNRTSSAEASRRLKEALEIVGLTDLADRPAPNLSGGQQQRVALARALAVSTSLLLMDEPMSNLDARLRQEVRSQIRTVTRHYDTTVLYVTHDQEEAMALADEIALMRHGEIMQRGTPEDLYDRSVSRQVAEFFGAMNWVAGQVEGANRIRTELGPIEAPTDGVTGRDVLVGLRPEHVRLNPPDGHDRNVFDGRVTDRVFLGAISAYTVSVGGVTMRVDAGERLSVGDRVRIELPPSALRVFENS